MLLVLILKINFEFFLDQIVLVIVPETDKLINTFNASTKIFSSSAASIKRSTNADTPPSS